MSQPEDDDWIGLAEDVGVTFGVALAVLYVFVFVLGFIAGALIT